MAILIAKTKTICKIFHLLNTPINLQHSNLCRIGGGTVLFMDRCTLAFFSFYDN